MRWVQHASALRHRVGSDFILPLSYFAFVWYLKVPKENAVLTNAHYSELALILWLKAQKCFIICSRARLEDLKKPGDHNLMCKGCRSETLNKSIIPIIAYKLVLTFMFSLWCGGQQERMVMPVERLKSNVV